MSIRSMCKFKHSDSKYNTFVSEVYKNDGGILKQRNILYNYLVEDGKEYAYDLVNKIKLPFGYVRTDEKEYVTISNVYNIDGEIETIKESGKEITPDNIIEFVMSVKFLPNITKDIPNNFDIKPKKTYTDQDKIIEDKKI